METDVQNDLLLVTCGDPAGFMAHTVTVGGPVEPSEEAWSLESGGSAKLFDSQASCSLAIC